MEGQDGSVEGEAHWASGENSHSRFHHTQRGSVRVHKCESPTGIKRRKRRDLWGERLQITAFVLNKEDEHASNANSILCIVSDILLFNDSCYHFSSCTTNFSAQEKKTNNNIKDTDRWRQRHWSWQAMVECSGGKPWVLVFTFWTFFEPRHSPKHRVRQIKSPGEQKHSAIAQMDPHILRSSIRFFQRPLSSFCGVTVLACINWHPYEYQDPGCPCRMLHCIAMINVKMTKIPKEPHDPPSTAGVCMNGWTNTFHRDVKSAKCICLCILKK